MKKKKGRGIYQAKKTFNTSIKQKEFNQFYNLKASTDFSWQIKFSPGSHLLVKKTIKSCKDCQILNQLQIHCRTDT